MLCNLEQELYKGSVSRRINVEPREIGEKKKERLQVVPGRRKSKRKMKIRSAKRAAKEGI